MPHSSRAPGAVDLKACGMVLEPAGREKVMPIRYRLVIYWSEEDRSFVVEVPELPGCMADGETYEQAAANAQQVIEEWLETAGALGRKIPFLSKLGVQ